MVRKVFGRYIEPIFKISKKEERLIRAWSRDMKSLAQERKKEKAKLDKKFRKKADSIANKYKKLGLLGLK